MKIVIIIVSCFLISVSTTAQETESWKELDEKGTQLYNEQKYEEGLEIFVRAVAAAKKEFGENHLTYASTLQSLAMLQLYTDNFVDSEKSFLKALEIHARLVGKNNVEYQQFLNGIVSLYMTTENVAQELKYHEEYRAVTRQVQGPNRDEYLSDLIQLADRYMDTGDYAKAERLLLEGKGFAATKEKWNGDFCARLFQLYAEQGDGAKADPFFNEAKQIRNKGHWGAFVLIGV